MKLSPVPGSVGVALMLAILLALAPFQMLSAVRADLGSAGAVSPPPQRRHGATGVAWSARLPVHPPVQTQLLPTEDRELSLQQRVIGGVTPSGAYVLTYTLAFSGSKPVRLWDALPETVTFITGSMTSNLSSSPVYSVTTQTVQWQGTPPGPAGGTLDFAVTVNVSNTVGITGTRPSPVAVSNTVWLMDIESGTTISSTVKVIVFAYPTYVPWIRKP